MTDERTLPERRLCSLVADLDGRFEGLFAACARRSYPATVGVVVRLPDGRRTVGADTVEAARLIASAEAFDPGPPPDAEPRRWALVVASPKLVGWVSL
jgi:hypothetical protein